MKKIGNIILMVIGLTTIFSIQLILGQTINDKYNNIQLTPEVGFSTVNWNAPDLTDKVNLVQFGLTGKLALPHTNRSHIILYAEAFLGLGVTQSSAQLTSITNPITHNSEKINSTILANHITWNSAIRIGYTIVGTALSFTPQAGLAYRNWSRNPAAVDNSLVITHESKYNLFQSQLGAEVSLKLSQLNQLFIVALCEPSLRATEKQEKFITNDNFETIKQLYIEATVPKTQANLEAVNATINGLHNSNQTLALGNSVNWYFKAGLI